MDNYTELNALWFSYQFVTSSWQNVQIIQIIPIDVFVLSTVQAIQGSKSYLNELQKLILYGSRTASLIPGRRYGFNGFTYFKNITSTILDGVL